jgi:hypothetical protein
VVKAKTAALGETETVPIDQVRPYWRNPRKVTDEAVNAVVESIKSFGFQQPIVVDGEFVIIVGHTRYQACRRLGYPEVEVLVASDLTPQQARQYRLVDNKAGELSTWDFEKLVEELAALDQSVTELWFPEITDEDANRFLEPAPVDGGADTTPAPEPGLAEFVCPHCFHSWTATITIEAVTEGRIGA